MMAILASNAAKARLHLIQRSIAELLPQQLFKADNDESENPIPEETEGINETEMQSSTVVKPFIRPYKPTDEEAVMHICRVTAHHSASQDPANAIVPYIFALPYLRLYPSFCFVIDPGTSSPTGSHDAIGYILAVPCTKTYLERYKSVYLPSLSSSQFPRPTTPPPTSAGNEIEHAGKSGPEAVAAALLGRLYNPDEALLHSSSPEVVEEYPAHLHIDILPEAHRQGWGRKLMEVLVKRLREEGVQAIHLIKAGDNMASTLFYGSVGFQIYGEVMDGGASGEKGRKEGGGVCMVQKI